MSPLSRNRGQSHAKAVIALAVIVLLGVAYYIAAKNGRFSADYHAPAPATQNTPSSGTTATSTAWKPFVPKPGVPVIPNDVKEVIVKGCVPSPKSVDLPLNARITFTNPDAVDHYIVFSPTYTFKAPAKGSNTVRFDFWKYPGTRSYTCDKTAKAGSVNLTAN